MDKATSAQRIELLTLLSQLQPLENIAWVHSALEDAKIALHSGHRLASDTLGGMQAYAARWKALDRRLRVLYSDSLANGVPGMGDRRTGGGDTVTEVRYTAVCIAVWKILNGGRQPSGSTYGVLRGMWVEKYGYPPPIEMVPTGRQR